MANRLRTTVQINGTESDVELELTPEQASLLLEYAFMDKTVRISLLTPGAKNGQVKENPAAYAVE